MLPAPRRGKHGRLEPSEPFHMSTRRGGKGRASATPSEDGYVGDDGVKDHASFDEPTSNLQYYGAEEPPLKWQRTEGLAASTDNAGISARLSRSSSPSSRERSPSAPLILLRVGKRPRDSGEDEDAEMQWIIASAFQSADNQLADGSPTDVDNASEKDLTSSINVLPPVNSAARRQSPSSEQTDDDYIHDALVDTAAQPSPDATPAPSDFKPIGVSGPLRPGSPFADDMEDPTNDPNHGEDADEVDDIGYIGAVANANDDPRRGRRLPGKRRADHPDPAIEAALRRQLELKTNFRAIVKALKPMLAEVTQRTMTSLEDNEHLHEQVTEFREVQQGLDDRLQNRLSEIRTKKRKYEDLLMQDLERAVENRKRQCVLSIAEAKEAALDQLEYKALDLLRAAEKQQQRQAKGNQDRVVDADQAPNADQHVYGDGDITENEDDIIPRQQRMDNKFRRTGPMEREYESRSRLRVETQKAVDVVVARHSMRRLLANFEREAVDTDRAALERHSADEAREHRRGSIDVRNIDCGFNEVTPSDVEHSSVGATRQRFTVMDSTHRARAASVRDSIGAAGLLADAAVEAERREAEWQRRQSLMVTNEQAAGLQLLSDQAIRPAATMAPTRAPAGSLAWLEPPMHQVPLTESASFLNEMHHPSHNIVGFRPSETVHSPSCEAGGDDNERHIRSRPWFEDDRPSDRDHSWPGVRPLQALDIAPPLPPHERQAISFNQEGEDSIREPKRDATSHPTKTTKEERGGQSRKEWKKKHRRQQKSLEKAQGTGATSKKAPKSLASIGGASLPPRPNWTQAPMPASSQPTHFPLPPTSFSHGPSSYAVRYSGPALQPSPWANQPPYPVDFYNPLPPHRNSYPPQPWFSGPPPSPLYAMPGASASMPSGNHTDYYPYGPLPPPQYAANPAIAAPPPVSSAYSAQYGGPPIAPAAPDTRFGNTGPGPNPQTLPAFAQQERQERDRRRHNSEASRQAAAFRQWHPHTTSKPEKRDR